MIRCNLVHATHDLIILEASDVQRNNETADNSTDFDEHPHNSNVKERISVPLSRPTRETNVTHDGNGHVLVQLPSKDNITTDVVVGESCNCHHCDPDIQAMVLTWLIKSAVSLLWNLKEDGKLSTLLCL